MPFFPSRARPPDTPDSRTFWLIRMGRDQTLGQIDNSPRHDLLQCVKPVA